MKSLTLTAFLVAAFVSGYCSNADSAAVYFKRAIEFSQARKPFEADKNFQKAVDLNPDDLQTRIEYGNFLADQKKHFLAITQYITVLKSDINQPVALQKVTDLYFQMQRWQEVTLWGGILAKTDTKGVKYMLGRSYLELENYGQAKMYLNAAIIENPKDIKAVTLLGKTLIELSEYKQAINVYVKTIELDPNNSQLIYELGLLYFTMNDEKTAVKYFELAKEKGYKVDLDFLENLGMAYLSQDIKKGVETLEKVLQRKPNNAEILFQIGQAYYKVEKYQDAADTYYRVYSSDPSNVRALYMTGVAYQKKGDKGKGIMLCEQAIKLDPNLASLKTQKFSF